MHMCHNSDYQSEKVGTTDAALNQSTFGPYYGGHTVNTNALIKERTNV